MRQAVTEQQFHIASFFGHYSSDISRRMTGLHVVTAMIYQSEPQSEFGTKYPELRYAPIETIIEVLDREGYEFLVATNEVGAFIGLLGFQKLTDGTWRAFTLNVPPHMCGTGISRALLRSYMALAHECGVSRVFVSEESRKAPTQKSALERFFDTLKAGITLPFQVEKTDDEGWVKIESRTSSLSLA